MTGDDHLIERLCSSSRQSSSPWSAFVEVLTNLGPAKLSTPLQTLTVRALQVICYKRRLPERYNPT